MGVIIDNIIYNDDKTMVMGCSDYVYNVKLLDTVREIAPKAFSGHAELESIELPKSLRQINSEAFANCYSLKNIHIPDSVNFLGDGAFKNCTALEDVYISETTQVAETAFAWCDKISIHRYSEDAIGGRG